MQQLLNAGQYLSAKNRTVTKIRKKSYSGRICILATSNLNEILNQFICIILCLSPPFISKDISKLFGEGRSTSGKLFLPLLGLVIYVTTSDCCIFLVYFNFLYGIYTSPQSLKKFS